MCIRDRAFAAVANSRKKLTLSVNANITFLRPAKLGYVYAEAVEVFNHQRIPFVEVKITDGQGAVSYTHLDVYKRQNLSRSTVLKLRG